MNDTTLLYIKNTGTTMFAAPIILGKTNSTRENTQKSLKKVYEVRGNTELIEKAGRA
jgi:hypothetical protein